MKAGFVLITVLAALSPLCLCHRRCRWLGLAVMTPAGLLFFWTKAGEMLEDGQKSPGQHKSG